jgi:hypothetical protein
MYRFFLVLTSILFSLSIQCHAVEASTLEENHLRFSKMVGSKNAKDFADHQYNFYKEGTFFIVDLPKKEIEKMPINNPIEYGERDIEKIIEILTKNKKLVRLWYFQGDNLALVNEIKLKNLSDDEIKSFLNEKFNLNDIVPFIIYHHRNHSSYPLEIPANFKRFYEQQLPEVRKDLFNDLAEKDLIYTSGQEYGFQLNEYQSWMPFYTKHGAHDRDYTLYVNCDKDSSNFGRIGILRYLEEHSTSEILPKDFEKNKSFSDFIKSVEAKYE